MKAIYAAICALGLLLAPSLVAPALVTAAHADSVALTDGDLVGLSELIVVGRVVRQQVTAWGPSQVPVTVITVAVASSWRGAASATVDVWQAGGPMPDGRWMIPSNAVRYRPGQPVVLFLERSSTGVLVTAGSDLGALDASGAVLTGLPALASLPDTAGESSGTPFRGMTLREAEARVKALAGAPWPSAVPR